MTGIRPVICPSTPDDRYRYRLAEAALVTLVNYPSLLPRRIHASVCEDGALIWTPGNQFWVPADSRSAIDDRCAEPRQHNIFVPSCGYRSGKPHKLQWI